MNLLSGSDVVADGGTEEVVDHLGLGEGFQTREEFYSRPDDRIRFETFAGSFRLGFSRFVSSNLRRKHYFSH